MAQVGRPRQGGALLPVRCEDGVHQQTRSRRLARELRESSKSCREAGRVVSPSSGDASAVGSPRRSQRLRADVLVSRGVSGTQRLWRYQVVAQAQPPPPQLHREQEWECEGGEIALCYVPEKDEGLAAGVRKLLERSRRAKQRQERQADLARATAARRRAAAAEAEAEAGKRKAEAAEMKAAQHAKQQTRRSRDATAAFAKLGTEREDAAAKIQAAFRGRVAWDCVAEDGWRWFHGAEFPEVGIEELWDMFVHAGGQTTTSLWALEFVDVFMHTRKASLTAALSRSLPAELRGPAICREGGKAVGAATAWQAAVAAPPPPPAEDLSAQQVARLCALLLESPRGSAMPEIEQLRSEVVEVRTKCAEASFEALGLCQDSYLSLRHFRKLLWAISCLMSISESVVILELAWVHSQVFRLPTDLGNLLLERGAEKRVITSPVTCSQAEFSRLCRNLDLVDANQQDGVQISEILLTFTCAMQQLGQLVLSSRQRRLYHRSWRPRQSEDMAQLADLGRRKMVGWTELSALLEKLFRRLPRHLFRSPLQMCTAFLVRRQHGGVLCAAKVA